MRKPSFLERITGAVGASEIDDAFEDNFDNAHNDAHVPYEEPETWSADEYDNAPQEPEEGELPVDMYQTGDNIVIRALVAGVDPNDLEISITRDMVTIRGRREEYKEAGDNDYYYRELFWGGFTRSIVLPEEIVIDEAEALEKHGLLEITLPKVDKDRSTSLKVKTK